MKRLFFSTLVLTFAVAFSLAIAGEKAGKSTKTTSAKKEMKGCCADDGKSAKACSDKDMRHCATMEAKAATKAGDAKTEAKTDAKEGKKN